LTEDEVVNALKILMNNADAITLTMSIFAIEQLVCNEMFILNGKPDCCKSTVTDVFL